ncbi:MAG TPA: metallophosphoesterase [Candidatus Choladousia intestinigallinarum]|nr:metallophosphoesterase [Candidatus Choladousia intestinigallinarum]
MAAVILSPFYLLLNYYLLRRMLLWFSTLNGFMGRIWFAAPFTFLFILLVLSPLAAAFTKGRAKAFTQRICNYWLGILMYLLIFLLLADLTALVFRLIRHQPVFSNPSREMVRIGGGVVFFAVLSFSGYGIFHARHLKTVRYQVSLAKSASLPSLKIALAADFHLGYNTGKYQIQRIVRRINRMHPDLILFAGDIFDNDFDAIQNPEGLIHAFRELKSTYGAYACWGNHDISEVILAGFTFSRKDSPHTSDPRMDAFLKSSGIRLLEDETLLVDNAFYLIGRLDASCQEKSGITRLAPSKLLASLQKEKPVIVLDHQPSQLNELSEAGADLVLSGHTHDGQLFPGNLTTRLGWENSRGLLAKGKMISIVTSGAGVWGPAMRVGTCSEVAEITVKFLPSPD